MTATPDQTLHGSYLVPSLIHATVADAMHPGVMTCDGDATITDIARMMASKHVHCIAVVSEESRVRGIVSDLDIVRAGVADGGEQTAASIATGPVISVSPETPLREAALQMLTHRTPHVVVVDPATERPVGMLSTLDIAGILAWGEA
jgi:CBS domain-containing protein